jgi:uncharacterized protein involved in exopolysaccharide biosynthesis
MEYYGGDELLPVARPSHHLRAIVRRWWLVVGAIIVPAVLAYAWTSVEQPRYDATAKVLVSTGEPVNQLLHSTAAPSLDPERDLDTAVALVKTGAVAQRVRRQLHLSQSVQELLSQVTVGSAGITNVVAITARDAIPLRAAKIANAFALRYMWARRAQAATPYRVAANLARRRLASLGRAARQGPQGAALRAQLRDLETTGWLQTGATQTFDKASIPTTAATPRPKLAAFVGAFLGGLIGLAAALAAGAIDRRVFAPSLAELDARSRTERLKGAAQLPIHAASTPPARR